MELLEVIMLHVETYQLALARIEDKEAAIAIMQEAAKDRRQTPVNRSAGWKANGGGASEKQIAFLKKLGVTPPEGITKQEASKMIDEAQLGKALQGMPPISLSNEKGASQWGMQ